MGEISLNNIIRVSVQGVQSSIGAKNINEIALFTSEGSTSTAPYMIAVEPSAVVEAYGTNSLTAQMVNNIFAQNPNIISGRGYVAVIPLLNSVSAKAASFTTAALTVSAFNAVTNGSLTITVNGTPYSLTGMNFKNVATVADVAQIIQNQISTVIITEDNGKLVFSSKKVGSTSSVVLSSSTTGTDISGADYLNVATGTTAQGANSSGETIEAAIQRIKSKVRFTGVVSTLWQEDSAVQNTSAYINSNDYIYLNVWADTAAIEGVCSDIAAANQNQTRCLVYTNSLDGAKLMLAAYVGRAFSVNFSGSATSQTMMLKTLTNVLPDNGITQNDYTSAKKNGVDLYVSYEGDAGVFSSGGNKYFDVVYENLALKYALQAQMYNALKTTNTKVPQTEAGMAVLRNAMGQVFEQFVRNGVIAAGKWNSAQTFGDPSTFINNIANQGWYVYSTPIAEQLQSEREQRIAPMIQGACKRAGAIHEADIMVLVEE